MGSNLAKPSQIILVGIIIFSSILLIGATLDIFHMAQGTGNYLWGFSFNKGLAFIGSVITSAIIFLGLIFAAWKWERSLQIAHNLTSWRDGSGWLRWLLAILTLILPIVVFQYSDIGSELNGFNFRLLVLLILGITIGFLINSKKSKFITSSSLALSFLIISSTFAFTSAFINVVGSPFSLSWSEGNRIWDYSILFGRNRYNFPSDQAIFAFIDKGRQTLWGLPFLIPSVSIVLVRLWNAILITLPYAVLGWIAFQRTPKNRNLWLMSGLWTFVFLSQGPIYTPLVLSAILVAIAWLSPLWIALLLIVVASFYAQWTRFTWMFAPAMWIGMLYLGDKLPQGRKTIKYYWGPAIAAMLAGLVGGDIIPRLIDGISSGSSPLVEETSAGFGGEFVTTELVSLDRIIEALSRQPLIWTRLLPNPTFTPGILLALLLVTLPLIIFLIYLVRTNKWPLNLIQKFAIMIPMSAFLIVGLIISTKIGGGGDLHNMDMFLVGLVFVAALAWKARADRVIRDMDMEPKWIQALIILMVFIFSIRPVTDKAPLNLPPPMVVEESMEYIREKVAQTNKQGEILFLDQRQLLTFGYVENVPLVADYEKKYLMEQAMRGNADYFTSFHEDIENHRFDLIISEPLHVSYKGSDYHFGVENDAWVKWVSEPVLCNYKPIATLKEVRTQLLVPRFNTKKCP
jgi:hypothetical protein